MRFTVANRQRTVPKKSHIERDKKMTKPMSHAKLSLILPAVLNPATAALVGIGLIAVGLYRMLPDDEEDASVGVLPVNGSKQAAETVKTRLSAVQPCQTQISDEPAAEARETANANIAIASATISDSDQGEIIRKAMSELGKRSAAARAKKKADRDDDA